MKRPARASLMDHFALWVSLGASLFLMPFGALLVPALSIGQAALATVTAALISGLLIAAVASAAASSGQSTAELLTTSFGRVLRVPIALILLARHMLFALFALILIADAAELISDRSLGTGLRPLWVIAFAVAGIALFVAGQDRAQTMLRRVGVWLVLLVALAITVSAYAEFEIPSYLRRPPAGGWPSFWQATDIMLVFPLLWLPVVADFARRSAESRAAAAGSFAGVFLTTVWFGMFGILYLPATDSGDIPGFLVGMQLGLGALVLLFLLQIDEMYASTTAAVPALEALRFGNRVTLIPAMAIAAMAPLAIWFHVSDVEPYILLAAAAFVPAFGVVIAQTLVQQRGAAAPAIFAWACGFAVYQWITPAEMGWWRDGLSAPFQALGLPFPLSNHVTWLGSAVTSVLVAGALSVLVPLAVRMLSTRPRAPEPAT
jgi:NCS1 family nucleobase:cation symporter-1